MQTEMLLDLVGGFGEKPASLTPSGAPSWDDIEYSPETLAEFYVTPIQELADQRSARSSCSSQMSWRRHLAPGLAVWGATDVEGTSPSSRRSAYQS
jgi:hypothetical protein